MSINGGSVITGATGVAYTGGSYLALSADGVVVPNGIHVSAMSQDDFRTREHATFKNRNPSLNPLTGEWTKSKREAVYVVPTVDAVTGKTVFNTVRQTIEAHPSLTAAQRLDLQFKASTLLLGDSYLPFWSTGNLG